MSIFNRRNAALGWLTWTIGKRVAEKKARSAVGGDQGRSRKLIVGALAALGAVVFFWRRREADEQQPPTS